MDGNAIASTALAMRALQRAVKSDNYTCIMPHDNVTFVI